MKKDIMRTIDGEIIEMLVPESESDHAWLRRNSTAVAGIGEQGDDDDPEDAIEDDWVDDPDGEEFVLVGG